MSDNSSRGVKRAAGEQKEREEKAAPIESLFELPDLFGLVQDFAAPGDLARLSMASAVARRRLLSVPEEAQLREQPAPDPVPAGYVDPHEAAKPYALRLLSKPDVREFLTDVLFPAERAVMLWAFRDPDVAHLLSRERAIQRDERGMVVYPGVNSTEMWWADREHVHHQIRTCSSQEEYACPSNALWERCFTRFLTDCAPKIDAAWRALRAMESRGASGWPWLLPIKNSVHATYTEFFDRFVRSLPQSNRLRPPSDGIYRKSGSGYLPIFAMFAVSPPNSLQFEQCLQDEFLERVQYWEPYDFETFARLLLPLLLRTFRARVVFMHAWFPYTDVLRDTVYALRNQLPPQTMYVLGDGSFDTNPLTRQAAWLLWTRAYNGERVSDRTVPYEVPYQKNYRLAWQYDYFEAYEFGCTMKDVESSVTQRSPALQYCHAEIPEPAPELPSWRLTAHAIVSVAKAMCVNANYRRLQKELAQTRGVKKRSDAVRGRASALFASDDMFQVDAGRNAALQAESSEAAASSSSAAAAPRI